MLNITNEVADRYHIEFGSAKSKILKIGNKTSKPDIYLGEKKLEYTDNYKYLGEMLNQRERRRPYNTVEKENRGSIPNNPNSAGQPVLQ